MNDLVTGFMVGVMLGALFPLYGLVKNRPKKALKKVRVENDIPDQYKPSNLINMRRTYGSEKSSFDGRRRGPYNKKGE